MLNKRKGYRAERKIRLVFERNGWVVIRAGASLGDADLICLKNKKCILLQIKSTNKKTFYYYGYNKENFEGFPFYVVVDFGYNRIRVLHPKKVVTLVDGRSLKEFIQ